MFAAYVIAVTTGLRRGELLGLCWDSVDLEQGIIIVKRQLIPLKNGVPLEKTTKTKSGRRSVVLPDDAISELKAHRRRQLQEKLLLGKAYQDHGLYFVKKMEHPSTLENLQSVFSGYLKKLDYPE